MANELENRPSKVIDGELVEESNAAFAITINQSTGKEIVRVSIPKTFDEWTPLQRAAIIKTSPQWAGYEIPQIMFVDAWARKHGLDLYSGRVYMVDGKPATDDEAKIDNAMRTKQVEYLTCSDFTKATNPRTGANDFYVEATLKMRGETKDRTYKAWFSSWNNPKNLAWQKFPEDRLRRKAMARICDEAVPMGGDAEAFIPAPTDSLGTPLGMAVARELEDAIPTATAREIEEAIK